MGTLAGGFSCQTVIACLERKLAWRANARAFKQKFAPARAVSAFPSATSTRNSETNRRGSNA